MTREEFVNELKNYGFRAVNEKGCVMVITPNIKDLQVIQKIALQCGYGLSFGWRKAVTQDAQA